ncbi:MAG TPA: hypothetical protein VHH73_00055 [Verrucomicrobiae bacterium]|nr:hypothetical protein [Verrucomicrobiae bacterium]
MDSPGYQRAFFRAGGGQETFSLSVGQERAGLTLVSLDGRNGHATLRRGTDVWELGFPIARRQGADFATSDTTPWPPGYEPELIRRHRAGQLDTNAPPARPTGNTTASSQYIAAMRDYGRQLPPAERAVFQAEVNRFAATPIAPETPAALDAVLPNATLGRDLGKDGGLPARDAYQPPVDASSQPGTREGDATEIGRLRALYRQETDPAARLRIQRQLLAFTSPGQLP